MKFSAKSTVTALSGLVVAVAWAPIVTAWNAARQCADTKSPAATVHFALFLPSAAKTASLFRPGAQVLGISSLGRVGLEDEQQA